MRLIEYKMEEISDARKFDDESHGSSIKTIKKRLSQNQTVNFAHFLFNDAASPRLITAISISSAAQKKKDF